MPGNYLPWTAFYGPYLQMTHLNPCYVSSSLLHLKKSSSLLLFSTSPNSSKKPSSNTIGQKCQGMSIALGHIVNEVKELFQGDRELTIVKICRTQIKVEDFLAKLSRTQHLTDLLLQDGLGNTAGLLAAYCNLANWSIQFLVVRTEKKCRNENRKISLG